MSALNVEDDNTPSDEMVQEYWDLLCSSIGVNDKTATKWKTKAIAHYSEPQRYYHTLTHVMELKRLTYTHQRYLHDVNVIGMAIWFHDIIYDPTRSDNEEKSAELWIEFAKEAQLDDKIIQKVYNYIIATKTHKIGEQDDFDMKFFLDIDMAILGSNPDVYDIYASNIRKEYIHVPLELYKKGRAQVLEGFMKSKIYLTDLFHGELEEIAKSNMSREIQSLLQ